MPRRNKGVLQRLGPALAWVNRSGRLIHWEGRALPAWWLFPIILAICVFTIYLFWGGNYVSGYLAIYDSFIYNYTVYIYINSIYIYIFVCIFVLFFSFYHTHKIPNSTVTNLLEARLCGNKESECWTLNAHIDWSLARVLGILHLLSLHTVHLVVSAVTRTPSHHLRGCFVSKV